MQLSQPLSFADQAELYVSTNKHDYMDPFSTSGDPRLQRSLGQTWEKFRKLAEAFVVLDKGRTNGVSVDELLVLAAAVGLGEVAPSFSRLLQKLPKSAKGAYEFDRCFRGLQKINYPKMVQLPAIAASAREARIAPTLFRGSLSVGEGEGQVDPATHAEVNASLASLLREFNVALIMLDAGSSGYVTKKELKILLRCYNLHEARANYIMSRLDRNGDKRIAFVEFLDELGRQDYPSFRLAPAMGPNPVKKHAKTVKAMTARSNYTGSLSGSTRGDRTQRSDATSNDSLASYMSTGSTRSSAMESGRWPGHRQMTYVRAKQRSERSSEASEAEKQRSERSSRTKK
jgi:Ca2+-binding EF-hand superfamily protein